MGAQYSLVVQDTLRTYRVDKFDITLKELWRSFWEAGLSETEQCRVVLMKSGMEVGTNSHYVSRGKQTLPEIAALVRQFANNDYRNCRCHVCSPD